MLTSLDLTCSSWWLYYAASTNEDIMMKTKQTTDDIRLSIWTTRELYAAVKAMAKDNNRAMSGEIREVLTQAVAAHRAKTGGWV